MRVPVRVPVFLFHRNQTAVRRLAHHMLKLQRRVVDPELLPQHLVDSIQNPVALRRRNVRNRHMT